MDVREDQLHQSYVSKARNTDRVYCGTAEGAVGVVERKLVSMGEVKGLVLGVFGKASEATHSLIHSLAEPWVRVAGPQWGRRGHMRLEEAEIALATSFLRRTLSILAVKEQAFSLLGRLEGLGPGAASAARWRSFANMMESRWQSLR